MNTQNIQTKKFFLYARKSTDTEERQVRSIDDQIAELQELAKKENIEIVKIFIEKQTAKEPGRPIFNEMLSRIEKNEAQGILAWHPDRLARNSVDGGKIIWLVDTGKINELKFPCFWFENTPQGKFMLQIAFGQSKYYVDNLSENIKRGIRQKLKNGLWPSQAPLGYLNDKNTKSIIVDKNKAKLVKKSFELYSTGKFSLRRLCTTINNLGLIGRKNKMLSVSNYQYFLKNPFYCGLIRYNGELYEGKHEPIIAKKLFDECQEVMKSKGKPNKKKLKYFVFRGFIRCGECGCLITAETQKGHNYYHCTKRKTKCFQKYVREEELEKQISGFIQKVFLPDDWAENIITEIEKEKSEIVQSSNFFAQNIKEKIKTIDEKLERLIVGYLENAILLEEYQQNKNKLVGEKQVLKDKLSSFEQKRNHWFEPAIRFVKSAKYAGILAKSKNFEEKRDFFKKLGSNFKILNQKIVFDLENPFKILADAEPRLWRGEAKNSSCITWRRGRDSNPRYP
ncbi:MAG: recombinase family protein [Patescibacteria group bacterium]|nr:recombinase family protein [Patescibacteria group bacterium]MBU2461246.1 recombinase family protein [Patescibacteria group bacterium]